MTEEEARGKYWKAIYTLEELIKAGHCSKQEIVDDLDLLETE